MKRDLYAEVSARIVAELEVGAAPWIKPWSATPGANTERNAVSNRPYSGCNVILLWMAQAAGYFCKLVKSRADVRVTGVIYENFGATVERGPTQWKLARPTPLGHPWKKLADPPLSGC